VVFRSAARLLALGVALGPTATKAQTPAPTPPAISTLRDWLESRFADMGRNCLGDKFKLRKKGSAVPSEVLRWGAIQAHLGRASTIYPTSSMSTVLAQPVAFDNGVAKAFGSPLTVTWPVLLAPTLEAGYSEGRRVQNCSTLVTGNADLKVDVPIVRAALDASHSTNTATTNYLYAGRIISPFAWAIVGGGSPASTPPIPRFTILLGIWDWYRRNPTAAARTDIALRGQVDGLAIYSVQGVSQQTLLSGDADVRFGMPFLTGGASSRGTAGFNVTGDVKEYASVIMRDHEYAWLPGATQIATLARGLGRVQPAANNPTATDGTPFRYAVDVQDVPRSMCDTAQWAPTITVQEFGAEALDSGACRFHGLISPGPSTEATFPVAFGVESVIVATSPVKLTLVATSASLTDERALLSLNIVQIPTVTLGPAGASEPVSIPMNFAVVERGAASALALSTNESALKLSCSDALSVALVMERSSLSRDSSDQASLLLVAKAPASAFAGAAASSSVRCQVDGTVSVRRRLNGVIGSQQIRLPSVAFDATQKHAGSVGVPAGATP
jgi:hypothetical protein